MKNNFGLILLSLALISSFVCALDYSKIDGFEIPSNYQKMVGNQKINVFIDNSFVFALEINQGRVGYSNSTIEKPSLEVYVLQSTIDRIQNSTMPGEELSKAYKSGEIRVVKKTFANKIKLFFARFFIK